jgi:transposase
MGYAEGGAALTSAPVLAAFETSLAEHRARAGSKSLLGQGLAYISKHWDGLRLFLADGRVALDSNAVERLVRPIAPNRKNAFFTSHDAGAENWAMIASLIGARTRPSRLSG